MKFFFSWVSLVVAVGAIANPIEYNGQGQVIRVAPEVDIFGITSSLAKPEPVPDPVPMYEQFAGIAQQVNCRKHKIGMKVGDAELLWSNGDDDLDQRVQIYLSKMVGLTVAWAGQNVSSLNSILTGATFPMKPADFELFPFARKGSMISIGIQDAYKRVANQVLHKIQHFQEKYNEDRVSFTGLSLGAMISSLAMVHVQHNLKRGCIYRSVVFGFPRVGNVQWANTIDEQMKGKFFYVENGNDIVPHIPPRVLGFHFPSGQIWIKKANSTHWMFYPGQENVHGSNSEWGFRVPDHTGVYFNTEIGSYWGHCPATVGKDEK